MKIRYEQLEEGRARLRLKQPRGSRIRNFHVWAELDGNFKENITTAVEQLFAQYNEDVLRLQIGDDIPGAGA